jgi:hypothetical protein
MAKQLIASFTELGREFISVLVGLAFRLAANFAFHKFDFAPDEKICPQNFAEEMSADKLCSEGTAEISQLRSGWGTRPINFRPSGTVEMEGKFVKICIFPSSLQDGRILSDFTRHFVSG